MFCCPIRRPTVLNGSVNRQHFSDLTVRMRKEIWASVVRLCPEGNFLSVTQLGYVVS